ncbi:hypothetical protein [Corallococcus exiguus]|uniref:hypothetical protein n=1 Tax=Corallococcus exiguus TaxID=83462 RepID=UPI0020B7394C|nr:hypothetical protein [Corallococcus exiguus]
MTLRRMVIALGLVLAPQAALALDPPWKQEQKLRDRMVLESAKVCADGKGHYTVLIPQTPEHEGDLFYGDGKTFTQVVPVGYPSSTEGGFFEPRFFNPKANDNFRGTDYRVVSDVKLSEDFKTCALRCGEKNLPQQPVPAEEAKELLRKAAYQPSPVKFQPYALLRDDKGVYYLVERGIGADNKSFRIFTGQRGQVKQQKMLNVVTDSQGEIFSTQGGDLRLVVDREEPSFWVVKSKRQKLRAVPVGENLPFIYNELGVYTGARLGTPCDDV